MVGGGAAGTYGAIRAKTVAPHLKVIVIEKGKPLSKVIFIKKVFSVYVYEISMLVDFI